MDIKGMKHSSSGSLSEESDHSLHQTAEKSVDETGASARNRFYECLYCKRGFTNAQALGGHMNIHRKEKARAKLQKARQQQQQQQSFVSIKSNEELKSYNTNDKCYDKLFLADQAQFYEVPIVGGQMNYQYFFPGSNPKNFPRAYDLCGFGDPRKECLSLFEDHRGPNLSMQIGLTRADGEFRKNPLKENEVDLELRLGLAI